MEVYQAREYLEQIREEAEKLERMKEAAEDLKRRAADPGRAPLDPNGKVERRSAAPDQMAELVARAVQIENDIDEKTFELFQLKHRIIGEIQALKGAQYMEILWYRYVDLDAWKDIAKAMNISETHAYRLHGDALARFAAMYELKTR